MRRTMIAALMALAVTACGGAPEETDTAEAQVAIEGFLFRPAEVTVEAGTTVRWTNRDEILHTATSGEPEAATGLFDGQLADAGTTFAFTFADPGVYPYFCSRHTHMLGTVTVR